MDDTPQSEAKAQLEATKRSRAADFREVFGGKTKTSAQIRVLEYLESFGDDGQNSYSFQGVDGISIIAAGIHRDGAKSIIRVIHRNLSYAENLKPTPKVKAQSKR